MEMIAITGKAYTILKSQFKLANPGKKITDKKFQEFISELIVDNNEIIPTAAEKKQWKQYLYNSLLFLAEERPELTPRKSDSFNTLLESFLYWAEEYNDGYFSERDVSSDYSRYEAYLEQEYEKYAPSP